MNEIPEVSSGGDADAQEKPGNGFFMLGFHQCCFLLRLFTRCAVILPSLVMLFSTASGSGADTGFDGIYRGKMQIVEASQGGREYLAPTTLVVMPDLKSAIMTTTFPWRKTGALSTAIRGEISGRTFTGESKGKFQTGAYHYAMRYVIKFGAGTAAVRAEPLNLPSWSRVDTKTIIFRKVK